MALPLPPAPLRARISLRGDVATYEIVGARTRDAVLAALPKEFAFDGLRVLDFGCGAGRTLRHFAAEAERCDFIGCDIDEASVEWVRRHLSPPFEAFVNEQEPPLPLEAGSVDLILVISVFTHLADSWARWLAELHRLLRPGGLLFSTFLGPAVWPLSSGRRYGYAYDERIGMHVEQPWADYSTSHGPAVWNSPWWLEERWGRGFELHALEEQGFAPLPSGEHGGQGFGLWRRREGVISPEQLERPGKDGRELAAADHSALLSRLECAEQVRKAQAASEGSRLDAEDARRELAAVRASRIMRLSEPARRAWYRVKRG